MNDPAFATWVSSFASSRKGKAALRKLADVFAEDEDTKRHRIPAPGGHGEMLVSVNQHHLLIRVLEACFNAQQWAQAPDKGQDERRRDRAFAQSANDVRRQIRSVRLHLQRYRNQWLRQWINPDALAKLLNEAENAISIHNVPRGPWLHRFTFGCLQFEAPREANSPPIAVETPLLFQLVLLFRRFTLDASTFARYQSGEPMPVDGKPHYPVAAAFASAVHGVDISARQASERLRKLIARNNVTLRPWAYTD